MSERSRQPFFGAGVPIRPTLVVILVVDQMRVDYLTWYAVEGIKHAFWGRELGTATARASSDPVRGRPPSAIIPIEAETS
jgi:hypothetical protein